MAVEGLTPFANMARLPMPEVMVKAGQSKGKSRLLYTAVRRTDMLPRRRLGRLDSVAATGPAKRGRSRATVRRRQPDPPAPHEFWNRSGGSTRVGFGAMNAGAGATFSAGI